MLKVTFDSNVWRIVSSPSVFPADPSIKEILALHNAIANGQILPLLSETVFTLEAIKNADRRQFFRDYNLQISFSERVDPNGSIRVGMSLGPDRSAHPGNNRYLSRHLSDALQLGFRLLHTTRLGGIKNPDLDEKWFYTQSTTESQERNRRFAKCARDIEARGCGIKHVKETVSPYVRRNASWQDGLRHAPSSEDATIAKAVAEWADGDSIAAHYSYSGDFFCTRDRAKSSGPASVLSPQNRVWAASAYGIEFVTPEELLKKINQAES